MALVLPFVGNFILTTSRIYETRALHQRLIDETNNLYRVAITLVGPFLLAFRSHGLNNYQDVKILERLERCERGASLLESASKKRMKRHVKEAMLIVEHVQQYYADLDISQQLETGEPADEEDDEDDEPGGFLYSFSGS